MNRSSYVLFYVVLFSESFSHARSLGRWVGHLRSNRKSTERLEVIAESALEVRITDDKNSAAQIGHTDGHGRGSSTGGHGGN